MLRSQLCRFILKLVLAACLGHATTTALALVPTIDFYQASTTELNSLQAVRLSWRVQNAVRVDIYDGFRNLIIPALGNENYIEVWPERTATYRLLAYGAQGELQQRDITITYVPLDIEFFIASPSVVTARQPVRLSWKVQGAVRVDIADDGLGTTYTNLGNENFIEVWPERTTSYTLIATGQGRTISRQLMVRSERREPLIRSFTASTPVIYQPQPVYLMWSVEQAERVDLEDGSTGTRYAQVGAQGRLEVRPNRTATYTLWAYGPEGQVVSQQLTITVDARGPTIQFFRTLQPYILAGQSAQLEWRVEPASMIELLDDRGRVLVRTQSILQSFTVAPRYSTTYILRAYSPYGDWVEATARIEVAVPRTR